MQDLSHRSPAVTGIFQFFQHDHLEDGDLKAVSASCYALAAEMINNIPDSPELTVGLRKLLEAKDAFVRAKLMSR